MLRLHRYRLLISHAWGYKDDHYCLINYLNEAPNFLYANYSALEHDPAGVLKLSKTRLARWSAGILQASSVLSDGTRKKR